MRLNIYLIDSFTGPYRFLSNFYEHPFSFRGAVYRTAEHAYQAAKTDNLEEWFMVKSAATPSQAKRMGRTVTLRTDWNRQRIAIMTEIVRAKFSIPELRGMLLATDNEELVEGNNWGDRFWGRVNDVGANHLGKILMSVREEIQRLREEVLTQLEIIPSGG